MQAFLRTGLARGLALAIVLTMLSAGCSPGFLEAVPGLPDYQRIAVVPVPGGSYNTVAANLMIERRDLSVDTILGEQVFGAVYNSANGTWHWTHDVRFDGSTFIDPTGAIHDVSDLADGLAIPGTVWVKLGPSAIKSKGGWTYSFDSLGRVAFSHWSSDPYPRIVYAWHPNNLEVRRCPTATTPFASCPGLWSIQLGPHGPTEVVDLQSALAGTPRTATYTFDSSGRLQTARAAFEVAQGLPGSLYEYGVLSTLVSAQTSSEGERIEYAWDAGRRLTRVTQIGEGNPTHRFTHELTSVTADPIYTVTHVNPRGGTTRYHLDGLRRLVMQQLLGPDESRHFAWKEGTLRPWHVTDLDGTVRRFTEWSDDDPTRVIEPSGNEVRITYQPDAVNFENSMARAIREISDSIGPIAAFTYDAQGRPATRQNGEGEQTTTVYQGLTLSSETTAQGRIVRSHDSVRDQDTLLFYDAAGRIDLIAYTGLGESLSYAYDLRSRIIGETYTLPGSPAPTVLELHLAWDLADRPTRLTRADGTPGGELLLERSYVGQRLASIEYGNGLLRSLVYDASTLAFVGFEMTNAQQEQVESTVVSREVEAGPTRLVVSSETTSPLAQTREEYWLNRPGSLSQPEQKIGARVFRWRGWQDGVLDAERFFAWDELGNPAADSDGDVFSYNAERNRLLDVSGRAPHSYTYDERGYPVTRDGVPLAWTAAGMLSRVGPAWSPLVEITWDLGDRPVSITVAGVTREFPLFGGQVEYDASSGQLGWLHRDDVSIPFLGSARVYRHEDFRGNTSLVSDETGEIVAHKRYQPFGVETEILAPGYGEAHPTGFTGALQLTGTGLVWIGARILESDTGRFLTPDPLRQELQQYTYALGNPVWFWDPDGRQEEPSASAASGVADVALGSLTIITAVVVYTAFLAATPAVFGLGAFAATLGAVTAVAHGAFQIYEGVQKIHASTPNGGSGSRGSNHHNPRQIKRLNVEIDVTHFGFFAPSAMAGSGTACISFPNGDRDREARRTVFLLVLAILAFSMARLRTAESHGGQS